MKNSEKSQHFGRRVVRNYNLMHNISGKAFEGSEKVGVSIRKHALHYFQPDRNVLPCMKIPCHSRATRSARPPTHASLGRAMPRNARPRIDSAVAVTVRLLLLR